MRTWARIAEIITTKKLGGELVVQPTTGFSFVLAEGMSVFIVPPQTGVPRKGVVESIQDYKGEAFTVKIDSIQDREAAEALKGCSLLIEEKDLPSTEIKTRDDLIHFEVVDDVHAQLGDVVEVIERTAQTLLRTEGPFGEVLIPYVPEIVYHIDTDARIISTRVPKGLLDISANPLSFE